MHVRNSVNIEGYRGASMAITAAATATPILNPGVYDVSATVDVYIRVAGTRNMDATETADQVTIANGYKIAAGNVVPVEVNGPGHQIGAIAVGAGTLYYHQVGP